MERMVKQKGMKEPGEAAERESERDGKNRFPWRAARISYRPSETFGGGEHKT
jgi:hypothetical protein